MNLQPPFQTTPTRTARRRRHLLLASAAAALAIGSPAWAQKPWPSKPVRLVVAYPAGGLADVMARVLQPQLAEALGQPVVIDNRGGAAGNIAGAEVARNGDDHSFLVTTTTTVSVNPVMFAKMPFDAARDLQPVGLLANTQLFLITRPTLAPNTLRELVAYMKANPGKLSYGSAGTGTTPHLGGELFKQGAGVFATHIPYRGAAPAIQDVMAGQIDYALAPGTVFPTVDAGKLKLLAVASRERTANRPDAPTFAEQGVPNVFADTLFGVWAPKAMPQESVARFNQALNHALAQPAVRKRFGELGADAVPMSPSQFQAAVQQETVLFTGIVKARGISAE
ncbi:MAG: tripartite tricarboxylate transporter substrate-binding protein [Burkholderiaceae bacterium]